MNQLPIEKRCAIIFALVEGNSMRSTSHMVGVSINNVNKLLVDVGRARAEYQYMKFRNLTCKRLQLDGIWGICYAKKNVPEEKKGFGKGDVWTWTANDADTKLVPSWLVGQRDGAWARLFVTDLAGRLAHRVQITSDGLRAYVDAVEVGFGGEVDFAQLIKIYGRPQGEESRYSPPDCIGCEVIPILGSPDPEHISTSYVGR